MAWDTALMIWKRPFGPCGLRPWSVTLAISGESRLATTRIDEALLVQEICSPRNALLLSASRRTWSLYSAVNRRRTARSRTSGSGTVGGGTTRSGAVAPFTIAGLGASGTPSWLAGGGRRRAFGFLALAMTETPLPALYSNFGGGQCLTIIGTEGTVPDRPALMALEFCRVLGRLAQQVF